MSDIIRGMSDTEAHQAASEEQYERDKARLTEAIRRACTVEARRRCEEHLAVVADDVSMLERAVAAGEHVCHLGEGVVGKVDRVYARGAFVLVGSDGRAQFVDPALVDPNCARAETDPATGEISYPEPPVEVEVDDRLAAEFLKAQTWSRVTTPIAMMATGDGLIVRPGIFVPVTPEVAGLRRQLEVAFRQVLVGFAVESKRIGSPAGVAVSVAQSVIRRQLASLDHWMAPQQEGGAG